MSEEDEEQEIDALERLKGELGEKYEADMNNIQVIQVITFPSFFIIHSVTFENETNAIWFMSWFLFNIPKEMCILGLSFLLPAPLAIMTTLTTPGQHGSHRESKVLATNMQPLKS